MILSKSLQRGSFLIIADEEKRLLENMGLSEDLMTEGNILGFSEVEEF